ncbi:MAG: hypothetical protein V4556_09445 [Bacteroidota bacterium]
MRKTILAFFILCFNIASAQELFVFTEPASNMAARSIGIRMNTMFMKNVHMDRNEVFVIPEIMWGVSRNIMIHADVFFNNDDKNFKAKGASLYLKYRFLSKDDIHNHFRLAAFGRYSKNNGFIHDGSIDMYKTNTGYEGGLIATKLINRVAISASSSYVHAFDNGKYSLGDDFRNAVNYSLSLGTLLFPKEYTSYDQPNLNFMIEMLGQNTLGNNKQYFLDLAPSLQLILKSRMRIDVGYRFQVIDKIYRAMPKTVLVRFEYNLFNVY